MNFGCIKAANLPPR